MDAKLRNHVAEPDRGDATSSAAAQVGPANPWKAYAGIWRDNPDFDAFLREVEQLRRETDEATNREA